MPLNENRGKLPEGDSEAGIEQRATQTRFGNHTELFILLLGLVVLLAAGYFLLRAFS